MEKLKEKMIRSGWGKMEEGRYPRPYLWDWLEAYRPEVLDAYTEWFDQKVRGK